MNKTTFKFPINDIITDNMNWDGPGSRCYTRWLPRSHKSFGLSLQDLYQRYKAGEGVMYFSLGDLTKTDFEARMIAMLGDYISPRYEPFAYKYGLGKGIIGNFATHYVVGDIHINNFKKAFPENRRIYSFALGRYI